MINSKPMQFLMYDQSDFKVLGVVCMDYFFPLYMVMGQSKDFATKYTLTTVLLTIFALTIFVLTTFVITTFVLKTFFKQHLFQQL
jgi:hypothetical protein